MQGHGTEQDRTDTGWLTEDEVAGVLELARTHLGTDVAWVTEFSGGRQVVLASSGDPSLLHAEVGGPGEPVEDTYCVRVLRGELPEVVPDARHHPVSAPLPITERMGIGSYVGVPLHGPGGTVTGMLCALGRTADPRLDEQAPRFLAMLAAILSERMSAPDAVRRRRARERAESVEDVLDAGGPAIVHQPLVRLPDRAVRGFEALARFDSPAFVSPAHAFAVAAQTGHGVELEASAARAAMDTLPRLARGQTLTVNLSAEALADGRVVDLVLQRGAQAAASGQLLAVEVTEHTVVDDYPALRAVRERLRAAGLAVYVDDAGAGYASLHHVLELRPDVIKVDIDLVRHVDTDPARAALIRSLVAFAREIRAVVLGEGVETAGEHAALVDLGVTYGQGFYYGRPGPLPDVLSQAG
ncbi:sensor domain-containing phosphodiesterase [Angustibacter aerolatus]